MHEAKSKGPGKPWSKRQCTRQSQVRQGKAEQAGQERHRAGAARFSGRVHDLNPTAAIRPPRAEGIHTWLNPLQGKHDRARIQGTSEKLLTHMMHDVHEQIKQGL